MEPLGKRRDLLFAQFPLTVQHFAHLDNIGIIECLIRLPSVLC